MQHIWAPWRIKYVEMKRQPGCILCDKPAQKNDAENYVLFRGEKNFVMLNAYPYAPGHLLISPLRHVGTPEDLTKAERNEHFEIVSRCVVVLRQVFKPSGFNIGSNISKSAGAGIDDHFHTHIVPRWHGDTNFMTTVADVKVLPEALADSYCKLKGKF